MTENKDDVQVDRTLPSELYSKFIDKKDSSPLTGDRNPEYHEAMLQNMLSSLAAQTDLTTFWKKGPKEDIPKWLWKALTLSDDAAGSGPKVDSAEYEWWMGACFIKLFAADISPFELHSVVNDSIIFADGSLAHSTLCLLLCVFALRQCPSPIEKRWKRWQSLVCETIRLFQNYGVEVGGLTLPLWIHHIVPACLHLIRNLPEEANRLAFVSSLVGTCCHLASRECRLPETTKNLSTSTILQDHLQELLETVRLILNEFGYSETWVWLSPWRKFSPWRQMEERCDEVEFIQNKDKIEWWSGRVHRHESVAGMDTSWDDLGISLLAILSYENRPKVLSANFIWKVWFPHVALLLKSVGGELQFLEPLPIYLLDNLVKVIPDQSLPSVGTYSKKVDAPFETFQLLSNRILTQTEEGEESRENETISKARSERMVNLMKNLLTRYQPINQVKIVRKLVHDCPHPGLRAKFMDLLRPVIFNEEASEALWSYIKSFVKDLLDHHDEEQRTLVNLDDLVEKVEIFVGAITMIQLWVMVKGKVPKKISAKPLGRLYKTLKKMLESWLDDTISMAPDNYYRLYLLEGALGQVMSNLDSVRGEMKRVDCGDSQSTPPSRPQSSTAASDKTSIAPAPIVGEVDIFL
jgi:hypothetical protein